MAADLRALRANSYTQALGLAILSVLFAAALLHLGLGPGLPTPAYVLLLLLACGTMLAAFVRLATHRASSRLLGAVVGAAAYLLFGFVYGLLRYAIAQDGDGEFLILMSTFMWPWILLWDAGCIAGLWHCVTLGN